MDLIAQIHKKAIVSLDLGNVICLQPPGQPKLIPPHKVYCLHSRTLSLSPTRQHLDNNHGSELANEFSRGGGYI